MHNKTVHMITFLLLVVGGLNWLLVGVFGYNLVEMLLGGISEMAVRAVYVLVGLSAIYELAIHKGSCTMCGAGSNSTPSGM